MRAEKKQLVRDIGSLLEPASAVMLVSYKGLTVADFSELRANLDEVDSECHVIPLRLFRIAAAETGRDNLAELDIEGDTAVVTGAGDPVAVAKKVRDFAADHPEVAFKAGVVESRFCESEDLKALADLPAKEVLQAQLLGVLTAPAQKLAGVLNAKVASIAYVLQAYREASEKTA